MVWVVPLSGTKLIPRSLTPANLNNGIRSLIGFGRLVDPLVHSVLYPHYCNCEAIPKYISERTSYHLV